MVTLTKRHTLPLLNQELKGPDDNFRAEILGCDGKLPDQPGAELGQSLGFGWQGFPKISYR